jgi:hypothetical protein
VAAARGGEGIERGLDGGGIWGPPLAAPGRRRGRRGDREGARRRRDLEERDRGVVRIR